MYLTIVSFLFDIRKVETKKQFDGLFMERIPTSNYKQFDSSNQKRKIWFYEKYLDPTVCYSLII